MPAHSSAQGKPHYHYDGRNWGRSKSTVIENARIITIQQSIISSVLLRNCLLDVISNGVERMVARGSPHGPADFEISSTSHLVARITTSAAIDAPHAAVASPWLFAVSHCRPRLTSCATHASSRSPNPCHSPMWAIPTAPASFEPPRLQPSSTPHTKPSRPQRAH
jgi:hypothetical protein